MLNTVNNLLELLGWNFYYVIAVGFGVVFIILLWLKLKRATKGIVPFKSAGGKVEIAPQTIRGLINGTVSRIHGIEHVSCRYTQRGRKLSVQVYAHLRADVRLKEMDVEVKRRVKAVLNTQIGMDPQDIDPVNLKITKIVGDPTLDREPTESGVEDLDSSDDRILN